MNGCSLNIKNEICHHFCRRPRNLPSTLVQWAGGPSLRISYFPSSVFFWTPDTSRRTAAVWTRTSSVHGRETQKTSRDCLALEKIINTAIRIFQFSFPYQPEKFPWPKRDIPRQLYRKWYPTRNDPIFPTFSAFLLKIEHFSTLAPKIRASNWYNMGFQPISLKK